MWLPYPHTENYKQWNIEEIHKYLKCYTFDKDLEEYKKLNIDDYFVCIAKTPASFSDNPKLLNVPKDHTLHIRQINIAAGSKFIIPISGTILTMPGLPKIPAAVKMEEENGN